MRRPAAAAAVTALILGGAWLVSPAVGDNTPDGETLVNDEIVVAELDPTGLPIQSHIISRLSSNGGEPRTVLDPTSTANVEYLNRRGRPTVTAEGIEVEVGGPEPQVTLTKALVDKPMPLAMHAEYRLDGDVVDPMAVVGADGRVRIAYTVTNTDVEEQRIRYTDAAGRERSKKLPVFAPMVGTLTTAVPESWEIADPGSATVTTDDEGNNILTWSLVLYPPLGDYTQTVAFEATTAAGSVPRTVLTAAPAQTSQDPSAAFSAELLEQSADGSDQLASGLDQLNNQTLSLAQGAAQLADGISQVSAGADQLNRAVASDVVPGTAAVAEGATGLAAGADGLAKGTDGLATGADGLASGAAALADGQTVLGDKLGEAATGADQLSTATDGLADGLRQLATGAQALSTGLPQLSDGAEALLQGADKLADAVGSPADPPLPTPTPSLPLPPSPIPTPSGSPVFPTATTTATATPSPTTTPTLEQGMRASIRGALLLRDQLVELNNNLFQISALLQQADSDLCSGAAPAGCAQLQQARTQLAVESARAYGLAYGGNALYEALELIGTGVDQLSVALRSGSDQPGKEGLVEGLAQLADGLSQSADGAAQLSQGADQASDGAGQLATGNSQLAQGLGAAAGGADQLADGGQKLAGGSRQLADGTTGLADGAGELADGAGRLADGADQLSFGTEQVSVALAQLASGAGEVSQGGAQLASGAAQLQSEGTQQVYDSVVDSSDEPAQATAYLKAADARVASALPYGAPEGAKGNAAYLMTMDPVTPGDTSPFQIAALLIVLAAAGAGAVLKQLQSG